MAMICPQSLYQSIKESKPYHRKDSAWHSLLNFLLLEAIQRGQEQLLHDEYKPPLDRVRPISPQNPRQDEYLDAARTHNRNR